jgi:PAS domain S-box-containing protein
MSDTDKSKEELLQELQELKKENESLKQLYINEVSVRTKADEIIKETHKQMEAMFDHNQAIILIIIPEIGIIVDANNAAAKFYGYSKEQLCKMRIQDLSISPPDEVEKKLHLAKTNQKNHHICEQRIANGEIKTIEIYFTLSTILNKNIFFSIIHDITERKKAEEELKESKEKYQTLFENNSSAIALFEVDTTIIMVNEEFCKLCGYNRQEIIGMKWTELIHSEELTKLLRFNKLRLINPNDAPAKYEFSLFHKSGNLIYAFISITLLSNKQIIASLVDITEQKKAEKALSESELRYRNLFDKANEGLILLTMDGKIAELNQSFAQMHGFTVEEMKNMDIKDLDVLREDAFDGRAEVMRHILAGEVVRFEVEHYHKDGHSFFMSDTVSLITIAEQQYFLAFHQDITERKLAEEALLESEEKYKQIFDNTFDIMSIYEVTEEGRYKVINFNNAESKLIGNVEYYQNRYIDDCIPPELFNQFKQNYERCIIEEKLIVYDEDISFGNINKTFNTQLIPLKNNAGRIHRIIVISRDITEIKLLNTQLINQNEKLNILNNDLTFAKEKAEESDRLKTAFLMNISHEIRTPLNGILGFSKMLQYDDLSKEEITEFTGIIQKSGDRLMEIVHNVLDISKIETGQFEINKKTVSIKSLITDLYGFFIKIANEKELKLNYHLCSDNDNFTIFTDESKLNQILKNLINNAIKFTYNGSVDFGYEIITKPSEGLKPSEGSDMIQFYVKDTGIGISSELHDRIFERFTQAEDTVGRNFEGAGLGLAICKGLVELLGGRIWVESEDDNGSTFYFTIPINPDNQIIHINKKTSQIIIKLKKLKILIVEDDKTSFDFLKKILLKVVFKDTDFELIWAKDGEQAVELVKSSPDIDIILMDMRMPVMSGFEATKIIKQIRPELPIIAQTAYAFNEEKEKIHSAGCDDYISKPIQINELKILIDKYLSRN